MAIPLYGSTGALFERLGKLGALIANMRSHQATQYTAMVNTTTGVVAQLNAEADIQAIMGDAYIGILSSIGSTVGGTCQQLAEAVINRMVFRDNPRINQNLTQTNTQASVNEIIRQMELTGATVRKTTITATPGTFTGNGNGIINASVYRPLDGKMLENSFSENVLFTCSADSYSGGTSEGNEAFDVTGVGSEGDYFQFDWPLGSNASTVISAIDGDSDATNGNLLTNSGFANWTSNVPDNFSLVVGAAGTNIARNGGIVYSSGYSAAFIGDGATLTEITQEFGSDTVSTLDPQTQYSFNLFAIGPATPPATGVLEISLVDDGGNVIADEAGTNNLFTIDLTTLPVTWTSYTGSFRTPAILPDPVLLRIRLSTALESGKTIYLDKMSMGLHTQLYIGGPFFSVHSGNAPFLFGDYGSCNIANARGSGGTLNTWQTVLAVLLPSSAFGDEIIWPSSTVPTVSDGLLA